MKQNENATKLPFKSISKPLHVSTASNFSTVLKKMSFCNKERTYI